MTSAIWAKYAKWPQDLKLRARDRELSSGVAFTRNENQVQDTALPVSEQLHHGLLGGTPIAAESAAEHYAMGF